MFAMSIPVSFASVGSLPHGPGGLTALLDA